MTGLLWIPWLSHHSLDQLLLVLLLAAFLDSRSLALRHWREYAVLEVDPLVYHQVLGPLWLRRGPCSRRPLGRLGEQTLLILEILA